MSKHKCIACNPSLQVHEAINGDGLLRPFWVSICLLHRALWVAGSKSEKGGN